MGGKPIKKEKKAVEKKVEKIAAVNTRSEDDLSESRLQLSADVDVFFVSNEAEISFMVSQLQDSEFIGLDAEWNFPARPAIL